jgi:hypothetical protein
MAYIPTSDQSGTSIALAAGFHQCRRSGMFIPDPDFYPSRISIPDPTTKEEGKIIVVLPLFVATNITKLKIILFLNR